MFGRGEPAPATSSSVVPGGPAHGSDLIPITLGEIRHTQAVSGPGRPGDDVPASHDNVRLEYQPVPGARS